MSNVSRRNFLEGAAAVGMLAALGGCGTSTDGSTSTAAGEKAPDAGSYPIDPDGDSVKAKWSSEMMKDGWTKVTQDGAPTLGYTDGTGVNIIQVDGYAFKDLNRNGKLTCGRTGVRRPRHVPSRSPPSCPSSSARA